MISTVSIVSSNFLRIVVILQVLLIIIILASCKKNDSEIPKSLQEYFKNQGIQETIVDLNYSSADLPDRKYLSLTVTYNFSSSDGKPQKELLGFILKMDGNEWKIDRNTAYTKSEKKAKELLSGAVK